MNIDDLIDVNDFTGTLVSQLKDVKEDKFGIFHYGVRVMPKEGKVGSYPTHAAALDALDRNIKFYKNDIEDYLIKKHGFSYDTNRNLLDNSGIPIEEPYYEYTRKIHNHLIKQFLKKGILEIKEL
jgi:hypothetical protein